MNPTAYTPSTFQNIILTVLAILIIMICGWCVYAFFRAIFLFIFSQGNDEKIKSAWSSIRYMIWGIILTIGLLFVFPLLFKWIGVEKPESYSASKIFERAGVILSKVSSVKNIIKESQNMNQTKGDLYYPNEKLEPFVEEDFEL